MEVAANISTGREFHIQQSFGLVMQYC